MITPDQIQITSKLVYRGCGLTLCYEVNGVAGGIMMCDKDLMSALLKTGCVRYVNPSVRLVMRQGKVEFLEDYMRHALKLELVQKILAYHLNNYTAKPIRL